jgi:lipid-A-disaccharide synthase
VNLVAGERIAPELLQRDAAPAELAAALLPLLDESSRERALQIEGLRRVRTALLSRADGRNTGEHVADLAAELLSA